ncbi:hypothetical protein [Hymenobacter koreensis]|uniref:Uncharacterized protein n=1 Tax=Hymenobacter koreensis TaxID=1084523 RepID=A0ABP8IVU1_9BACT
MEPNTTIPTAVYAHINHEGQHLTVVKIQEAFSGSPQTLRQRLHAILQLAPGTSLLVLPTEGGPLLNERGAEEAYNSYLSTNTSAVADQPWQPLPA